MKGRVPPVPMARSPPWREAGDESRSTQRHRAPVAPQLPNHYTQPVPLIRKPNHMNFVDQPDLWHTAVTGFLNGK